MLAPGLKPVLRCPEGQETLITTEFLCATDADSADGSLLFLVARQPRHGVVLCRGRVVDRFVQAEVTAGTVSYRHTGESAVRRLPVHFTLTAPRLQVGRSGSHPATTLSPSWSRTKEQKVEGAGRNPGTVCRSTTYASPSFRWTISRHLSQQASLYAGPVEAMFRYGAQL